MMRRTVVWGTQSVPTNTMKGKLKHYTNLGVEGARHLYHGFRLFGVNIKLSWKYSRKLKGGVALTRRERMLLERATVDLIRLVPFSIFIIVPGGELLLPVALKMFPGLIPSTFESAAQGKKKAFQTAMKTMFARKRLTEFMTTQVLLVSPTQHALMRQAALGDTLKVPQIRSIAPLCGKDGPLSIHRLPNDILVCLATTVGVYKGWHKLFPTSLIAPKIRSGVLAHYRKMKQDDSLLDSEGMEDLTHDELVKANFMRGMRWTDSTDALLAQLEWWVTLSKDTRVPYNTLWWIKPTYHPLRTTLVSLPHDSRSELLGIQHLPPNEREALERLCEKVDSHRDKELAGQDDADAIAEKVLDMSVSEQDAEKDGGRIEVRRAIAQYLTDDVIDSLYGEMLEASLVNRVTVSDVTEFLASDIHYSSHEVSNVFDAFDLGSGSEEMSKDTLRSLVARCRQDSENSVVGASSASSNNNNKNGSKK